MPYPAKLFNLVEQLYLRVPSNEPYWYILKNAFWEADREREQIMQDEFENPPVVVKRGGSTPK